MTHTERLAAAAGALARLVYPARCVSCEAYLGDDALACERCEHAVFALEGPLCRVCGEPRASIGRGFSGVDEVCGRCLRRRPRFETARACWEYRGTIADALQRAKYRDQLWALRSLASRLRPWLAKQLGEVSASGAPLLTSVPMHPADLRERGFDAAAMLLRLAAPGQCERRRLLEKTRRTSPQASLDRMARLTNLRAAFCCPRPDRVAGRHVVLFDDVLTTGATASEVARTLLDAGCGSVRVLTAARSVNV
jgi:predicted amidophosphoribosyltransferase